MRISRVGLASLTGGEHPDPRRQLRWHIHHQLTISEKPVRDVLTDPVAAFDRPRPLTELLTELHHRRVAGDVSGIPAATKNRLVAVHHLDRRRPFVRVHAVHHCTHPDSSNLDTVLMCELGWHRYFEQNKPLLSLSRSLERRPARAGQMRATRHAWAAEMRTTGRAPKPNPARHRS